MDPILSRHRWRRFDPVGTYFLREVFSGNVVSAPSNLWTTTEYMLDETHRHKQIGKSNRDIGGPMKHFRAEWSMDSDTGLIQSGKTAGPPAAKVITYYRPSLSWGYSDSDGRGTAAFELWRAISSPSATDVSVALAVAKYGAPLWRSNTLETLGATAVARVKPTNPAVDTATTVAELISERGFFSRPGKDGSASGEWLNYQLGIAPSLGFAKDLRKAMEDSETIISQYERDAGRRVRRKYDFPWEISSQTLSTTGLVDTQLERPYPQSEVSVTGSIEVRRKDTKRTRFSGAFTYAAPEAGWRKTLSEVDRVYGVRPGSETAWNLIPLSFVADYWGNTGDVLGNLDAYAQDGLVMPYGYVTSEDTTEFAFAGSVRAVYDNVVRNYPISGGLEITTRERQAANPFGFGVTWGSLSPRRLSILAALGITRVR
jgi:hypothetical protein